MGTRTRDHRAVPVADANPSRCWSPVCVGAWRRGDNRFGRSTCPVCGALLKKGKKWKKHRKGGNFGQN
jgi:hypothetical protein